MSFCLYLLSSGIIFSNIHNPKAIVSLPYCHPLIHGGKCLSKSIYSYFHKQDICGVFVLCFPIISFPSTSRLGFSSVAQLCPTLCDPINCSTPGLPVHHQLPEFIQTHVHRVSDAIQPSHPLSSPSPSAPNPSQHQSLFQ